MLPVILPSGSQAGAARNATSIDIDPSFEAAHLARVRLLIETEEFHEAAAAVVFSLTSDRLSQPVIEWLEKLDEFLEANMEPPADLVNSI